MVKPSTNRVRRAIGLPVYIQKRRFIDRTSEVKPAELIFLRTGESGISWELFLGLGFLFSCSMYYRNLTKLILAGPESFDVANE